MKKEIRVLLSAKIAEIEIGKLLEITVILPKDLGRITNLQVLLNQQGENPTIIQRLDKKTEEENVEEYKTSVKLEKLGNYFFFFSLEVNGIYRTIKINRENGEPFITNGESPYWRVLVKQKDFSLPKWTKGAILYQVVLDRFYRKTEKDKQRIHGRNYHEKWGEEVIWRTNEKGEFHNNDFHEGNIRGLIEKLSYLKKLHVDIVYLSPINYSSYRYDRYAPTDHMQIDPDVGTFEDLKELHKELEKSKMYAILDIALDHCSSDSPIFQEALHHPNSPYRKWFYFDEKGNYRYWYGIYKDMPVFNYGCKELQEYIYGEKGVIAKYAPHVDGFRLDVAEELPDFALEGIRARANIHGSYIIYGEWWEKTPLHYLGTKLDSITNYPFTDAMYKYILFAQVDEFCGTIKDILENYPRETIHTMLNSIDTHDIVRAINILNYKWMKEYGTKVWNIDIEGSKWHKIQNGVRYFDTLEFRKEEYEEDKAITPKEYRLCKRRLKALVLLQYLLPGNPVIYYGTEVGTHGYKDPFNRRCFPWENMDKDLLHYYCKVGKMRKLSKVNEILKEGDFRVVQSHKEVLILERYLEGKSLLFAINRTDQKQKIVLSEKYLEAKTLFKINKKDKVNELSAFGGMVLRKEE